MLPLTRREQDRGFTLIEILIAIFIFAVVIAAVYGSYRATFHIIQGTETRLAITNSARIVLERFSEDLAGLVIGPGGMMDGERHDFSGVRGDSLSFVSSAQLVLSKGDRRSGYSLVQFQVERDDQTGLLDLYRADTILLPGADPQDEDRSRHLICRGLKDFKITYLGRDGDEDDQWQVPEIQANAAIPQQSPFPALVYVALTFPDNEGDEGSLFRTAINLP